MSKKNPIPTFARARHVRWNCLLNQLSIWHHLAPIDFWSGGNALLY
jgi:hypothetical protein